MEKENEKAELKMEVIQTFFENEFLPKEFLEKLHDVIVSLVEYAGMAGPGIEVKEVAKHTDFLSVIYETVKNASK